MTHLVAIVGRPNVGKSTLFNRLTGANLAIVHDAPGVTRDRHYADAHLQGRDITLIDTGGFDPTSADPMGQGIARHVLAAIEEADVIVCVLDGKGPPTEPDRAAVELLRKSGRKVVYAANKVDNPTRAAEAGELYSLGVDPLIFVSALHGRGTHELERAITERLPPLGETADQPEPSTGQVPRLALLGRPNAGKSSLLNYLAGTERSLVDQEPGTTRDPVDSLIQFRGKSYLVVDTAGIRRRSKVDAGVEASSVMRSIRAMGRAQVVVLMCDASVGVAEQDARLLGLCLDRKRAVVVGLNKLDLLKGAERKQALKTASDTLHFARHAPILGLSAKTGAGVTELMREVDAAASDFSRRVSTGELNRFFARVLEHQPPPTRGGRAPRVYYLTQVRTAPPVFVAMCSAPDHVAESYKRFVANQIRREFGFGAVPIVVEYRQRTRRSP